MAHYAGDPVGHRGTPAARAGHKELYGACFSSVAFRWGLRLKTRDAAGENVIVTKTRIRAAFEGRPISKLRPQGNALQGEPQVLAH